MTQLLDLSVLERDTVKLADGTIVELRNPEEFGIVDDFRLRTLLKQFGGMDVDSIQTEEQALEAASNARTLAALLAVSLPEEVTEAGCAAIIGVWVKKNITDQLAADGAGEQGDPRVSRRTTAASSRGSKRSTAATRKRGSTSRAGR